MKILNVLIIFLLSSTVCFAQFQKGNRTDNFNKGIPILISGVAFTVGAAFTPLEYSGGINSRVTPYHKQTAQIAGVVTGVTITGVGIVTTILHNNGKKRRKRW